MMKKFTLLLAALLLPLTTFAAGGGVEVEKQDWAFNDITHEWDKDQLLRGYTVATQVCLSCHSFKYISHRTLMTKGGFTEADAMQLADDMGMKLDDKLMSGLSDEDAKEIYAKALPDLSLMNKARPGLADYTYALLTGYSEDPHDIHEALHGEELPEETYFNKYFPGYAIAMPAPLTGDGMVDYHDDTEPTLEQMAKDVAYFMQWTAEPERTIRQTLGVYVLLYLLVMVALTWFLKQQIWARVKK